MQANYPFSFEREMGCTAAQLRGWLPAASGDRHIEWHDDCARLELDGGTVTIAWDCCEPRRIALIALPRLHVCFKAERVGDAAWQRFMRYFDLYTLRGGG